MLAVSSYTIFRFEIHRAVPKLMQEAAEVIQNRLFKATKPE